MTYTVEVTATAEFEAEAAFLWLNERTNIHAIEWLGGLHKAIAGLDQFPQRWPTARENNSFREEIRQLLYGKSPHVYRVLFVIHERTVHVLHVRHGARGTMEASEIISP